MLTATFDSPEMAQFVADIIRPYGVKQPKVNGSTMTIDDEAIEILADVNDQDDGHYDGHYIWVGGTEYAVTQIGRTRKGDLISLRIPAEDLAAGAQLASTLGIDRTELFRHYIHTGLTQGADPFRYTVEIQASTPDGNVWQALHPAETVFAKPGETAQDIAQWVASNQTVADGGNWRVVVWAGEDTGTEPAYIETSTPEPRTVTLISAQSGDVVPGVELADPDCPIIPGLEDRPDVQAFFAAQGYGPDDPDELMYLLVGDADIPAGFPTLTITLP